MWFGYEMLWFWTCCNLCKTNKCLKFLWEKKAFQGGSWCCLFFSQTVTCLVRKNATVTFSHHCIKKCCSFSCQFLFTVGVCNVAKKLSPSFWGHVAYQQKPLEGLLKRCYGYCWLYLIWKKKGCCNLIGCNSRLLSKQTTPKM